MNPADVAQSALPVASADVSLISLFWHAHFVVKTIMLGLLACSVWVWAIAIDKMRQGIERVSATPASRLSRSP